MQGLLTDWIGIGLRWLHVIVAIAWIGESLYFVALDNQLRPLPRTLQADGVAGEFWHVHGGGFYQMRKFTIAPPNLPPVLHWSKWPAYTTWLSGFALLSVLYFLNPGVYLIDRSVCDLGPIVAVTAALALLSGGWLIYDELCRLLARRDLWLGLAVALLILAASYIATHVFAPRAAFLLVGAMLATMMSGNVLMVIIPAQRRTIAALLNGSVPDPQLGRRGKQRSVHNTYFTLPVVFAMLSNHAGVVYTHRWNWVLLALCMLAGALIRQFFVLRQRQRHIWALPLAGAACLLGAGAWTMVTADSRMPVAAVASASPASTSLVAGSSPIANDDPMLVNVQRIISTRCVPCHATHPTLMSSPAGGLTFDTPEDIERHAFRIYRQAVELKAMPLGNATSMTDDERAMLARWFNDAQA